MSAVPRNKQPEPDRVAQVVQHLESSILSGKLGPGDRLPAERQLSEDLGVSRSVVREALGRLATVGLIESRQGSGTRVALPTDQPIVTGFQRLLHSGEFRLEHLRQVRTPLEVTIVRLAALNRTEAHLAALEMQYEIVCNPHLSLAEHVTADLEFHAILARASGNPLMEMVLRPLLLGPIQELIIETRRSILGRYDVELAEQEHGQILAAVKAQDPDAAEAALRAHIDNSVVGADPPRRKLRLKAKPSE